MPRPNGGPYILQDAARSDFGYGIWWLFEYICGLLALGVFRTVVSTVLKAALSAFSISVSQCLNPRVARHDGSKLDV
jgi:hypothetical protein